MTPHLYLDTSVILDAIHKRWQPSVDLMQRIKTENWLCSTSRFTVLEILDVEQEEKFIENLRAQGLLLSKIRGLLGNRRQNMWGLKKRELDEIYIKLYEVLSTEFPFITFEHPLVAELWDKAEDYCSATNIGATDAIHLASAVIIGCDILVTRDNDFCRIADDYILSILPEQIEGALKILNTKI